MKIYAEILLIMLIVVFVVDCSGFTPAWRAALGRWLNINVREDIKPFTCSLCMTHHVCVIYALCVGQFSLPVWVFICLCAFMAKPTGQLLIACRDLYDGIIYKLNKQIDKLWKDEN